MGVPNTRGGIEKREASLNARNVNVDKSALAKKDVRLELCMYLLMGYRSVILSYDDAALASLMSESINVRTVK